MFFFSILLKLALLSAFIFLKNVKSVLCTFYFSSCLSPAWNNPFAVAIGTEYAWIQYQEIVYIFFPPFFKSSNFVFPSVSFRRFSRYLFGVFLWYLASDIPLVFHCKEGFFLLFLVTVRYRVFVIFYIFPFPCFTFHKDKLVRYVPFNFHQRFLASLCPVSVKLIIFPYFVSHKFQILFSDSKYASFLFHFL